MEHTFFDPVFFLLSFFILWKLNISFFLFAWSIDGRSTNSSSLNLKPEQNQQNSNSNSFQFVYSWNKSFSIRERDRNRDKERGREKNLLKLNFGCANKINSWILSTFEHFIGYVQLFKWNRYWAIKYWLQNDCFIDKKWKRRSSSGSGSGSGHRSEKCVLRGDWMKMTHYPSSIVYNMSALSNCPRHNILKCHLNN